MADSSKRSSTVRARAAGSRRPARQSSAAGKPRAAAQALLPQGDVTLTDRAYAELEELIVTLQLPPGTALSELVLAKRLDIGRTPIREALQRLAADGIVIAKAAQPGEMISPVSAASKTCAPKLPGRSASRWQRAATQGSTRGACCISSRK